MSDKLPEPPRIELHGDKTNGIEFRWQGDDLDEVCMYVGGECVLHVERMSEKNYWMGLYGATHEAHLHFGSSGKAKVKFYSAEAWSAESEPNKLPEPPKELCEQCHSLP